MANASPQFVLFKDSIASQLLAKGPDFRGDAADELDDFASYLAEEAWEIVPEQCKQATYETRARVPDADTISLDAISASFVDTFVTYGLARDADFELATRFLRSALAEYLEEVCAPPPVWKATRTSECEICEREVGLTYHHLIPRSTHAKVLKKGWHTEAMLNKVAWLCRWDLSLTDMWDLCRLKHRVTPQSVSFDSASSRK